MVFRILNPHDSKQIGFSIVELVVTVAVALALVSTVFIHFNPSQSRKVARDEKRLTDIQTLDRIINEYRIDHNSFPGLIGTIFTSDVLPQSSLSPLSNPFGGWLNEDVSSYTQKIPTDPINDTSYHYTYIHNGESYEIDTALEGLSDYAQNDGGNNTSLYEIGTDLTLY